MAKKWIKMIQGAVSKAADAVADDLAEISAKAIGRLLIGKPEGYYDVFPEIDFLGLTRVEGFINSLNSFYIVRDKFIDGNASLYKAIIERHYFDILHLLKSYKRIFNKLKEVKSSIQLNNFKNDMIRTLESIQKSCCNAKGGTSENKDFKSFKIQEIIDRLEKSSDDEDKIRAGEIIKKKNNNLGTFSDLVVNLEEAAEKSVNNLIDNDKNNCAIYIYGGDYNLRTDILEINIYSFKKKGKGFSSENDMGELGRKINDENAKKSKIYIKEIAKLYKLCVGVHDNVKKLYYEAYYLETKLELDCLKSIVESMKKSLDNIHFFVFGAGICLCDEDSNHEDIGIDINHTLIMPAKGIFKLFDESKDSSSGNTKPNDVLYVRKMYKNLKGTHNQIKWLEKSVRKESETVLKIKKEYKSNMNKIKKLKARYSKEIYESMFSDRISKDISEFDKRVKESKTLKELTDLFKEYIKYLERVNKFKKEILIEYLDLEKNYNKIVEEPKEFKSLKDRIKNIDFKENIDFNHLKRLLKKSKNEEKELKAIQKKLKGKNAGNNPDSSN